LLLLFEGGGRGDARFYVFPDALGDELFCVLEEGVECYVADADCFL
jgi:hypothetical protein